MGTLIQRVPAVWGTANWIEDRPDLIVWEEAIYVPCRGTLSHKVVPGTEKQALSDHPAICGSLGKAPDATYLLLDVMTEHYGHFIADVLARLWPLVDRPRTPVKILCEPSHGRAFWERYPFIREILTGLDLDLDAVVSFDTAIILPRVIVPEPSLHNLRCVHAVFGDLCRLAGRPYWHERQVDTVTRPAYLAKTRMSSGTQFFANEGEVVDELDRLGVDILFPEEMSFADQVREFAMRHVMMGPVGSAFHTGAFSAPNRRTVAISGATHLNSNYLLFDSLNKTRAYYYFVPKTIYGNREGFGFSWTIPDPRKVAVQMLMRAENFDRIDAYDAPDTSRESRILQDFLWRTRRLSRFWTAGLGRLRAILPDRS